MTSRIVPKKYPMPEQDPKERIRNFREVPLGQDPETVKLEAARCLQCRPPKGKIVPPCVEGCPVGIDIPGFLALTREGRFEEAIALIKEKNALPAICGRVCPYENQCEGACTLGKKYEPVGIGRVERFLADWERARGFRVPARPPPTGKRVAVVGSGPAGLTAAAELARRGHAVTIFEALHAPGGVLVYGIPEFRLPKEIVFAEVEYVKSLGVELKLDVVVGKTVTLEELRREHDAVFIGTGAGLPNFMRIPGENLNGIYSANEFLTRSNLMKAYLFPEYDTPTKVGRRVATIGAGNVAMDCARTALRLGAEESYIVYRRSRAEMPARKEEIQRAEEEGVKFLLLTLPKRYIGDERGWVREVECVRMELGEPDESGRRRPVEIPGSEFRLQVDTVVVAIGQSPNPLVPATTPGLKTSRWGTILADEEGRTSLEGVWAGGDITTGEATVILAMGAGKRAAASIHEYLSGKPWPSDWKPVNA